MEDPLFATPVREVHLEIAIERTLTVSTYTRLWRRGRHRVWCRGYKITDFIKAGPFESKCDYKRNKPISTWVICQRSIHHACTEFAVRAASHAWFGMGGQGIGVLRIPGSPLLMVSPQHGSSARGPSIMHIQNLLPRQCLMHGLLWVVKGLVC